MMLNPSAKALSGNVEAGMPLITEALELVVL
jgi:hypothetical protein